MRQPGKLYTYARGGGLTQTIVNPITQANPDDYYYDDDDEDQEEKGYIYIKNNTEQPADVEHPDSQIRVPFVLFICNID